MLITERQFYQQMSTVKVVSLDFAQLTVNRLVSDNKFSILILELFWGFVRTAQHEITQKPFAHDNSRLLSLKADRVKIAQ